MKIYFTSGTDVYLKKLVEEHPQDEFLFMQNEDSFLLVHETEGDSFFKEPRKYEVIKSSGTFAEKGFAVFDHIPVSDEGIPLFEYHFKNSVDLIENKPGFLAIRVLRPLSKDTYVIFTLWENEVAYKNWKKLNSFEEAYLNKDEQKIPKKQKFKYFPRPPFITKYSIVIEEEKQE